MSFTNFEVSLEQLEYADVGYMVEAVLDCVIDRLCSDPALPKRSRAEWEIYFAGIRPVIEGKLDPVFSRRVMENDYRRDRILDDCRAHARAILDATDGS